MTERDASGREILLNSLNRRDEHKSRYTHNGIAAPMGSRDERKLGRASHQAKSGGGGVDNGTETADGVSPSAHRVRNTEVKFWGSRWWSLFFNYYYSK